MKSQIHRWSAGILAAILIGCGGQVTTTPPAGPEGTAVVTMTFTADSARDAVAPGVSKDASGYGQSGMEPGGVGGVQNEFVEVICDMTFGHAERTGNALTSTGIEIRDLDDPLGAACANPSKCVTCQRIYQKWDETVMAFVPDGSQSHCWGRCNGIIPANMASELDTFDVFSHFNVTVKTELLDVSLAAILYQGFVQDWAELDFTDVLDEPGPFASVVLDGTGDFLFSFLQDPFETHGLLTRDAIGLDSWMRGIDITALDPTPEGIQGSGTFHAQHAAPMAFTGATSGAVDLQAGPLDVAVTLCDDVNNCTAPERVVSWDLRDSNGELIAGDEILVLMPLDIVFSEGMDPATITENSIVLTMPEASEYTPQPEYSIEALGEGDGTSYRISLNSSDGYLYQNQRIQAMITSAVRTADENPAQASVIEFTLAGAASDGFVSDTHGNYSFNREIVDDKWAATEPSYESAAPYLDFETPSWVNRCLAVSDAAKDELVLPRVTIWPAKEFSSQARSSLQIDLKDVANFKSVETREGLDADRIGLRVADPASGNFLFIGVHAARAADGGVRPICEVIVFDPTINPPDHTDEPPIGDVVYGAWRDCAGVSNANFFLEYNLEMEELRAWMAVDPTPMFTSYEPMNGPNYNAYGADGVKDLPASALPRDNNGKSAVGVFFNSSAGNARELEAKVLKVETFGWASETLMWEPVSGQCGTPGHPCM